MLRINSRSQIDERDDDEAVEIDFSVCSLVVTRARDKARLRGQIVCEIEKFARIL